MIVQSVVPKIDVVAPRKPEARCFTIVVEQQTFGLPVASIQTVFAMSALTPVPLADPAILGLVNLRGKIVTAVSLRRRMHGRPVPETSTLAVGLDFQNESFALVVDEVGDVMTLDEGSRIEVPPHMTGDAVQIASVHRLETMILPILDLSWIFSFQKCS